MSTAPNESHFEDPRLTSFALGELDADEAAAFAKEIEGDARALAEIEEVRAQAALLGTAFGGAADAGLRPLQQERVVKAAAAPAAQTPAAAAPAARNANGWMMRAAVILGVGVSVGLAALWMQEPTESTVIAKRAPLPFEMKGMDAAILEGPAKSYTETGTRLGGAVYPQGTLAELSEVTNGIEQEELAKRGIGILGAGDGVDAKQVVARISGPITGPGVDKTRLISGHGYSGPGGQIAPDLRFRPGGGAVGTGGGGHSVAGDPNAGFFVTDGQLPRRGVVNGAPGHGYFRYTVGPVRLLGGKNNQPVVINGKFFRVPPGRGPSGTRVPGESYDWIAENPFQQTAKAHTSTFSLDVDTAAYANVRRFLLQQGILPPAASVRIEELVNYFTYDYAPPAKDAKHPFATHVQLTSCPWSPKRVLARVAVKGKVVDPADRPAANLVFLVDVSGSMEPANKLPLVKQGLRLLLEKLDKRDKVAIVTYAGQAGVALPSTSCAEKETIRAAIDKLSSGGSTNGEAGIQIAYRIAKENFIEKGLNRVFLATDGDFNVGLTERGGLVDLIQKSAKTGTYLSVLGFGMGNYKDGRMEALSNKGNGTYAYIDSLAEAKKVLVEGVTGQLVPIAKDVKVQVFFNPKTVLAYRLIGYENRMLAARDFNNDKKDAGDVGAGHTVTALYELVPVGQPMPGQVVDPNPYVKPSAPKAPVAPAVEHATALFTLRLRYKQPDGDTSTLVESEIEPKDLAFDDADKDVRFAAAVAAFGMKLRHSPHAGRMDWKGILEIAEGAIGTDPHGRRSEFLQVVKKAQELMP